MRKKLALAMAFSMAITLFTACGQKTAVEEQEPAGEISEETSADEYEEAEESDFDEYFEGFDSSAPVLDGSTALKPLGVGLTTMLYGFSREAADDQLMFHRTDDAYYYLKDESSDVLIAAEPCADVVKEFEEAGFEYEMEPIAMEGLVFVVNASNPVDSLTTEQIQKIYTGEITNWSQVGGDDLEIMPFQRTETSGSQVMMRKCVMKDIKMMDVPKTMIPAEMDGLIEAVRSFDGAANAIGYTVYYYANNMNMADGLKILRIDGVEPSKETISSGQYPFLNPYFCVIRKSEPVDSNARKIYDWFVTEDGQKLVDLEGYCPIK